MTEWTMPYLAFGKKHAGYILKDGRKIGIAFLQFSGFTSEEEHEVRYYSFDPAFYYEDGYSKVAMESTVACETMAMCQLPQKMQQFLRRDMARLAGLAGLERDVRQYAKKNNLDLSKHRREVPGTYANYEEEVRIDVVPRRIYCFFQAKNLVMVNTMIRKIQAELTPEEMRTILAVRKFIPTMRRRIFLFLGMHGARFADLAWTCPALLEYFAHEYPTEDPRTGPLVGPNVPIRNLDRAGAPVRAYFEEREDKRAKVISAMDIIRDGGKVKDALDILGWPRFVSKWPATKIGQYRHEYLDSLGQLDVMHNGALSKEMPNVHIPHYMKREFIHAVIEGAQVLVGRFRRIDYVRIPEDERVILGGPLAIQGFIYYIKNYEQLKLTGNDWQVVDYLRQLPGNGNPRHWDPRMSVDTTIAQAQAWHGEMYNNNGWYDNAINGKATFEEPPFAAFKKGKWSVIPLLDSKSLRDEGKAMHHCVGGYTSVVLSGQSYIYSIRRGPNRYSTLELCNEGNGYWSANQNRTHCNGSPVPDCTKFVKEWLYEANKLQIEAAKEVK